MTAPPTIVPDDAPADCRPGWSLPQRAYHDPNLFARELEAVFHGGWLLAATSAQLTPTHPRGLIKPSAGRDALPSADVLAGSDTPSNETSSVTV